MYKIICVCLAAAMTVSLVVHSEPTDVTLLNKVVIALAAGPHHKPVLPRGVSNKRQEWRTWHHLLREKAKNVYFSGFI